MRQRPQRLTHLGWREPQQSHVCGSNPTLYPSAGPAAGLQARLAERADSAGAAQLAVDFHRKDEKPADALLLDLTWIAAIAS